MIELPVYKGNVQLLETIKEVEDYFSSLDRKLPLVFDWETDSLEYDTTPLGLALYQKRTDPVFIPFNHYFKEGLYPKRVVEILNENFAQFNLIAHNAKFDTMVNHNVGVKDENVHVRYDTLIMIHCVDPDLQKHLEKRVKEDFGYEKETFDKIIGKKWAKVDWIKEGDELLRKLAAYAGEDVYWEWQMYEKYSKLMDEDSWRIHDKIELPLVRILRDAKIRGVKINAEYLNVMAEEALRKMEAVVEEIYEQAGCVFNLNSSKQKSEVFFDKLRMPCLYSTKKGGRSTDSKTMEELSNMGYPIAKLMVDYSELNKLYTGYLTAIPRQLDELDILRGDLNAQGTATGRFSSSNPNLQNQPNNSDFPVRAAFVPREGYVFINYDFSQIELRVMAHLSQDKHFLEVFRTGQDAHSDVSKRLNIPRKGAKVVNFGVLYGMGPDLLARTLDISNEEASKIINEDYMRTYSGFSMWKSRVETNVQRDGYVKTLFGRIRRLPEATVSGGKGDKRSFYSALRKAVNAKVQGTAADLMKISMIEMDKRFKKQNVDATILLTVHDEVLVEARIDQMFIAENIVKDSMENTIAFDVPILADGKILLNWGEMKDDNVVSYPYRMDNLLFNTLNAS